MVVNENDTCVDNVSNKNPMAKNEIIYLTGMSISKKCFQQTYRFMSKDVDFTSLRRLLIDKIKKVNATLGTHGREERLIDKILDFGVEEGASMIIDTTFAGFIPIATLIRKGSGLDVPAKNIDEGLWGSDLLVSIYENKKKAINNINSLDWQDFFAVYQSNQSDSRALVALASGEDDRCYALNYGYCDRPFYNNLFINSLEIRLTDNFHVKVNKLSKNKLKNRIIKEYLKHAISIFTAHLFSDNIDVDSIDTKSLSDFYKSYQTKPIDLKNSLKERNLFGIDLLSSILYQLHQVTNNNVHNKIKVFIDGSKNTHKLVVDEYCSSDVDNHPYIQELFEYAYSPELFTFVSEKLSADLIVSGTHLEQDYLAGLDITIDSAIEKYKSDFTFQNIYSKKLEVIKVPIKLFISLPLKQNSDGHEQVDRGLIVPQRLVHNANDEGTMNIITVGGIEHNRALMRLINFHRHQHNQKRSLGFLDNVFDVIHFYEQQYKYGFLMGINQPVSGFYSRLDHQFDDDKGISSNPKAHLIHFTLLDDSQQFTNKDLKWNILSVYGLSAIASAYASLYATINIKEYERAHYNQQSLVLNGFGTEVSKVQLRKNNAIRKGIEFDCFENMEKEFSRICGSFDFYSYLRIDYMKDKELVEFMTGRSGNGDAVIDTNNGRDTRNHTND